MTDSRVLLQRQAERQKRRAHLSWPEKMRMAVVLRETMLQMQSANVDPRCSETIKGD